MPASAIAVTLDRPQLLRALGVQPLRLRTRAAPPAMAAAVREQPATPPADAQPCKLVALAPLREEMEQPALAALYTKIGEAISSLGLQCVRIADAQADAGVRVLAFGDAALPGDIAQSRVLRTDPLAVLHADRERKRELWNTLRQLARGAGAG